MKRSLNSNSGTSYADWFGKGKVKTEVRASNQGLNGVPDRSGAVFKVAPEYQLCGKPTKAGGSCKARPVAGHMSCVGHMKQEAVS